MKLKVIITGTTGMVGKGVLLECLDHPDVEEVLVVNRSSLDMEHPKLKEIIHKDFHDLSAIKEELQGYNACFFCLGVSAAGMSEEKYIHLTYDLTKHFAETVVNPEMTFTYVSGSGTDPKGNMMWARVKGNTEEMLLDMPFKHAYMFRPGIILPMRGVKSKTSWYNAAYVILRPLFPFLQKLPSVTNSIKVGKAMIYIALHPTKKKFLENKDINKLAAH